MESTLTPVQLRLRQSGFRDTKQWVKLALEEAEAQRDRLGKGAGAREMALVITKLEEAQHWLRAAEEKLQ